MTYQNKKAKKRSNRPSLELKVKTPMARINQEQRIAHSLDAEQEIMRPSAEYRDKILDHHKY